MTDWMTKMPVPFIKVLLQTLKALLLLLLPPLALLLKAFAFQHYACRDRFSRAINKSKYIKKIFYF